MKKSLKLVFSILLIIGIFGASPIIIERNRVEQSNKTYQLVVGDNSIQHILDDKQRVEFYNRLKENNVSTVAFDNLSIDDLSQYRDIKYMTVESYLEEKDKFDYKVKDFIPKYASDDDIVIMLSKEDFSKDEIDTIEKFLGSYELLEQDSDMFFYINKPMQVSYKGDTTTNFLITSKFFIDKSAMEETVDNGLSPILSISNSKADEIQDIVFEQIMNLSKEFGIDKIQVNGSEVIGYPNNTNKYLEEFKKNNISIVTTEFETKIGLNAYLNNGKENIIRGHEIDVNNLKLSKEEFAARVALAVKERNMRVIVVTDFIDYTNIATISSSIDSIIDNLKAAQNRLKNGYTCGIAVNYSIMNRNNISEVFTALGSASIIGLLLLSLFDKNKKLTVLSLICSVIVFIGAIIVNKLQVSIGIKAYALAVAVLGSFAAVMIPYKSKIKSVLGKFFMTAILATITGLLVVSIMYGTEYILKLKFFSGIKLLYVLPPLLVAVWLILDSRILGKIYSNRKKLLNVNLGKDIFINSIKKIRWYHILLLILVLIGGIVYIRRSGNSGHVSELELELRRKLEELLYVRPRTKEFMLGYPAVLIAYYMFKEKIKYAKYMLIPAAIATMSTVNTFTHLHTPIVYSLLRTFYGVILGLIVGYIYILILKQINKFIIKEK